MNHPHLPCVVPGGGLSQDGSQWISRRPRFFLPVRVLSRHKELEKRRRLIGCAQPAKTDEGDRLESKRKMSFRMGYPIGNLVDEARMYAGFLEAPDQDLAEHPGDILEVATPVEGAREEIDIPAPPATGAVVIVHGHDELNLLRLKGLIRDRWRLEPIVLAAKPGKGRTSIV